MKFGSGFVYFRSIRGATRPTYTFSYRCRIVLFVCISNVQRLQPGVCFFVRVLVYTSFNNSLITRFRQVTGILLYIATKSNVSTWWGNDSSPGVIALRSIPRITSTKSVPPDVIQKSSVMIPIRTHCSRHNAFNTGLLPTNTSLTTLPITSVVAPQHAVIPLNTGSCLCSLGTRYRTGCFRWF